MLDKTINALDTLLNPHNRAEWVWKLGVLCFLTATLGVVMHGLLGAGTPESVPLYYVIVSCIASPFWLLGMELYRRMDTLRTELARIASTDILTGLANRRAFFERMQKIEEGQLLLLDVDHFKKVNDTYGHATGDVVLVEVARHLRESVREGDVVARFGGEEFAVFLLGATEEEAHAVADRMTRGLTVTEDTVELSVTLSAGLVAAEPKTTVSELIGRADAALYAAKAAGRARMERWAATARIVTRPT